MNLRKINLFTTFRLIFFYDIDAGRRPPRRCKFNIPGLTAASRREEGREKLVSGVESESKVPKDVILKRLTCVNEALGGIVNFYLVKTNAGSIYNIFECYLSS